MGYWIHTYLLTAVWTATSLGKGLVIRTNIHIGLQTDNANANMSKYYECVFVLTPTVETTPVCGGFITAKYPAYQEAESGKSIFVDLVFKASRCRKQLLVGWYAFRLN